MKSSSGRPARQVFAPFSDSRISCRDQGHYILPTRRADDEQISSRVCLPDYAIPHFAGNRVSGLSNERAIANDLIGFGRFDIVSSDVLGTSIWNE
jgi:hypothetical protein